MLASLALCKLIPRMPAKPKSPSLPRRSPCPIACALDLLGDKWTMLVVRDLFLGKQRFDEFLASSEGIATNILADRLKHLHEQGLITKTADEEDRRRFHYQLTPTGRSLRDVIIPLAQWGLANIPSTKLLPAAAKALR